MKKISNILPGLAGIAVAFIFGFSFLVSKQLLDQLSPLQLLAYRFGVAALFLTLLIGVRLVKFRFTFNLFRSVVPLAIFQPLIYFICEAYGVKLTSASESGVILSLIPVAVAILARVFLKEQTSCRDWLFILLSVTGVAIIVISQTGAGFSLHLVGIGALFLAVIAAAVYNIFSRYLSKDFSPMEITTVMIFTGALFFNGVLFLSNKGNTIYGTLKAEFLASLLYLGVLSSVIAFFLINYMLNRISASKTATYVNFTTVVSVIAGVIFRGEQFGFFHLVGTILILIGVWGISSWK